MFTFLKSFFSNDFLFEFNANKISIKSFSSKPSFEAEPYIALEKTKNGEVVKAIGKDAKLLSAKNVRVLNPFKHSKSLIADLTCAEKILQHGIDTMLKAKKSSAPRIIIHPLERTEGRLTDIEERILRELGLGVGAPEVIVYSGSKINTDIESFDKIKARVSDAL